MTQRPCLQCGRLTPGSRCPAHAGRNGSTRAWRAIRAVVLERDNFTCQACGQPAHHVDHIDALSRGGSNTANNLRALCARCNLRKGAR